MCLQEVQADHYEQHLHAVMEELGYDGMYKAKSREYTSQYGKVRHPHHNIQYGIFI